MNLVTTRQYVQLCLSLFFLTESTSPYCFGTAAPLDVQDIAAEGKASQDALFDDNVNQNEQFQKTQNALEHPFDMQAGELPEEVSDEVFDESIDEIAENEGPVEEEEEEVAADGIFGDYLRFEGYVSFVSDYRWRGVSQTTLQPAVQGQGFFRTKHGFYGSIWGSYVNFPDARNKPTHAELDFIVGNSKAVGDITYDIGFLYNYYPGAKGENYGESFFNIAYRYFATGMAYSSNVFDLGKSSFYVFGDLAPELPIPLPFCQKGVIFLLHVGHYNFSGSLNRSSYFDFKIGFAKTFLERITLDLSFISTDGKFKIDERDSTPTFVANLTISF